MNLSGKVAIVTGGARGIGRAISFRLAKEGADIVVADKNLKGAKEVAEEISKTSRAIAVEVDVSSEAGTISMVEHAIQAFNGVDILVNDAAIYYGLRKKSFNEITEAEWDSVMNVNLKGVWLCAKAVFPAMKKRGRGKIINLSSSTVLNGAPFLIHYVSSKAAVVGFTRALAREMGQYNVNVNAIAPGYAVTESSLDINPDPEFSRIRTLQRCFKRDEHPVDLVGTVAFLASDDSNFITGQTIVVDGGEYFN